jgi:hypothetical protein
MAAPRNQWQVYDTTEPLLVWHLLLPAPNDDVANAAVDDALQRLAASGLLLGAHRPLPDEATVFAGTPLPFQTRVQVRDERGALVERTANDAGALLRTLEGPTLDAGYARRFAAPGRPFVAAWSVRQGATVEVCVAFYSTIAFDDRDADVHAKNQARLEAARAALEGLARRCGGRLVAPLELAAR